MSYGLEQSVNVLLLIIATVSVLGTVLTLISKYSAVARLKGQKDGQMKQVFSEIKTLHDRDTELELQIKDTQTAIISLEKDILKEIRNIKPEDRPCPFFLSHEQDNKADFNRISEKLDSLHKGIAEIGGYLRKNDRK